MKLLKNKNPSKVKSRYLLRTEKNRITVTAATPIAMTGSQRLEKKGSAGIFPLVNGMVNDAP